ncbi:hypothetical protein V2J09_012971 [Rumex salicifolius]
MQCWCVLLLLPAVLTLLLHRKSPLCRATREPLSVEFAPICVTKRDMVLSLTATLFLPLAGNAAICATYWKILLLTTPLIPKPKSELPSIRSLKMRRVTTGSEIPSFL